MSVAKIIEVSATSKRSFEDAICAGIVRACKTVEDVQGAWVKEQKVVVEDGDIKEFLVDLKVTFVLHHGPATATAKTPTTERGEQ